MFHALEKHIFNKMVKHMILLKVKYKLFSGDKFTIQAKWDSQKQISSVKHELSTKKEYMRKQSSKDSEQIQLHY